jgi:O-antigen ligase
VIPARGRPLGQKPGHALLQTSRLAFTLAFVLAMSTPVWREGLFTRLPVFKFRTSGQSFQIGALALLPLLAGGTWTAGRLLERPRRRWHWGPAYVALPVLGFGALTLARTWPVHVQHIAAVTAIAAAILWSAYLYALSDWPAGWAVGSLAVLLGLQGAIGTAQFVKQGSIGLQWLGEGALDPQGQGISVIEVAGRRWLRAYGLTPHPNALGGYLSMSLLVCLGSLSSVRTASRPWLGLSIALGSTGLLFTFSRSAWLGTLAGLAYMAVIIRPWRYVNWHARRTRRMAAIVSVVLVLAVVLFVAAFGDLLMTRFFHLDDPLERRSVQDRVDDVQQAWSLIRAVPLKGTGSGYYVGALWASVGEERPPGFRKVHNVPLLAAAELGIPGAILWLWILLGPPVALARRHVRRGQDVAQRAACAGWAAAFVSALVLSALDNYLYITTVWWAALYLGVLSGQWARSQWARSQWARSQWAQSRWAQSQWAQRETQTKTHGEQQ